jgi:hypothetical protein
MIERGLAPFTGSAFTRAFSFYPRYWHGWIVFERPLLILGNIQFLRALSLISLILMLCIAIFLVTKRLGILPAAIFIAAILPARIAVAGLCIYFSSVFFILLSMIIFLCAKEHSAKKVSAAFFIVGSLVNYIDILSSPLLTLIFPLVIWILIQKKSNSTKIVRSTLTSIVSWGTGFGATWLFKWILSSIVLHKNIIKDAFNQAQLRSTGQLYFSSPERATIKGAFKTSIYQFTKQGWTIPIIFVIGLVLCIIFFRFLTSLRTPPYLDTAQTCSVYSAVYSLIGTLALIPLWVLLLQEHTEVHSYMTYRIYCGAVLIIFSVILVCLPENIWEHPWSMTKRTLVRTK